MENTEADLHEEDVVLFSMTWPPKCGVQLGDPTVMVTIGRDALARGDFSAIRPILDAT